MDSVLSRPVLDDDIGFLFQRPAWQARAACRGMDPAIFFPERWAGNGWSCGEAKAVCATCPVTAECGEAGAREWYGVWGGETVLQRHPRDRNPKSRPSPVSLRRR